MDSTTYLFICVGKRFNEMVIIIVGVFSLFSLSHRLLLYCMHLQRILKVCIFQVPKQFSPVVLTSRHLFSSATAMAASAPDVLRNDLD